MNFYIGNSIDEINEQDVNVEFCDELIDFIYKMSGQVSFDMSKLYQIDPYDDVEVSKNDLFQIAEICKYILDTALLQNYEEPDEGRQMVQDLLEIIQKAMTSDSGLVSIGDWWFALCNKIVTFPLTLPKHPFSRNKLTSEGISTDRPSGGKK